MGVEVQGLRKLRRKLGIITDAEQKAARKEVKRGLLNIQSNAKKRAPKNLGRLANSISHETNVTGLSGRAGTNLEYAEAVEHGSRPHHPPVDAIADWVRQKGLATGDDIESVAWAIAKKIAREGTPEQPFLFPAFEEERPKFLARLRKALDDAHRDVSRR